MCKSLKVLALAMAVAGGLAIAPLYAEEASPPSATPKGNTMMNGNTMMGGNNMMSGNGMMGMMTQMTQMMETCNKMMQASMDKEHGTDGKPAIPEKKG